MGKKQTGWGISPHESAVVFLPAGYASAGSWWRIGLITVFLSGQVPGGIEGQVVPGSRGSTLIVMVADTIHTPLDLATVLLHQAGLQGMSGPDGRVILRQVPPGLDTVLIRRIGYVPVAVEVRFVAGDTLRIDAVLEPSPLALNDIMVTARRTGLGTFDRRMRNAVFSPPNSFLAPEWLDTFPPRLAVSEILQKVGIIYRRFGMQRRLACPPAAFTGSSPVEILLNGLHYPDREGDFLEAMKRMEVRAIEIYRSPLELPLELSSVFGEDGRLKQLTCAVVIWTR